MQMKGACLRINGAVGSRPDSGDYLGRQADVEVATTLQALALTNGEVISKLIKDGAVVLSNGSNKKQRLVKRLFLLALGRGPTVAEADMLDDLASGENLVESVEGLLWAVAMLPEFQLIY